MALSLTDLRKRLATASPAPIIPSTISAPVPPPESVQEPVSVLPLTPSKLGFELQEKVLALQALILDKHPKMPVLLREIHTALRAQPENVTLMSEEEIAIIVDGLKIQTGVEFASSAIKGPGSKSTGSKIKQLGLGAF